MNTCCTRVGHMWKQSVKNARTTVVAWPGACEGLFDLPNKVVAKRRVLRPSGLAYGMCIAVTAHHVPQRFR